MRKVKKLYEAIEDEAGDIGALHTRFQTAVDDYADGDESFNKLHELATELYLAASNFASMLGEAQDDRQQQDREEGL